MNKLCPLGPADVAALLDYPPLRFASLRVIILSAHHHAHDGEEVPQEPHELSIEPVHEIAHDRVRYKIPDKDLCHLRFPALTRRRKLVRMIGINFESGAAYDL